MAPHTAHESVLRLIIGLVDSLAVVFSVLSLIKSHLRGLPYDEHALLTELRVIDEIVVEQCPPIGALGKIAKKYSNVVVGARTTVVGARTTGYSSSKVDSK